MQLNVTGPVKLFFEGKNTIIFSVQKNFLPAFLPACHILSIVKAVASVACFTSSLHLVSFLPYLNNNSNNNKPIDDMN